MTHRLLLLSFILFFFSLGLSAQTYDNYRSYLRDKNVKIDGGTLPIVFINVKGKMIQRNSHILAYMKIVDNGVGAKNYSDTLAHPGQNIDYEGWVGIKYRGNSSFTASDKKPFAIQTLATDVLTEYGGEKEKVKILGMGKDHKWAMLAPWSDKSMLRDALAFELGRPWFDYVPQTRFCEVILDGTYYGVYVFTERVSKGKKRLNLHDPGEDGGDLSGDYLVEVDRNDEACYFSQYHPWNDVYGSEEPWTYVKYQYKSPEDEDFASLPAGTREALHREIDRMEASFFTNKWLDPVEGYRKYIDATSFIDYMLATELAMNIDGYRLSTNMYKYSETRAENEGLDSRWKMSLWDFNIAYGNANYYNGTSTDKWQYLFNQREPSDAEHVPFYWYKMLLDKTFVSQMHERWQAYREGNCSDARLFATVDSLANVLTASGAVDRNQQAWQILGRSGVWPCPNNPRTYGEEMAYLKNWLRKRLEFMDQELLGKTPTPDEPMAVSSMAYEIRSGFDQDIVAEGTPTASCTTCGVDGGNVFYSSDVRSSGGIQAGEFTAQGSGVNYCLADFSTANAARLSDESRTATLTLASPAVTSHLYILGTSANGASDIGVRVNYTDGTSIEAGTISFADWSVRNPSGTEAVTGLGRCSRSGDSFASDPHYCLFDATVTTDIEKAIESVTFSRLSGVQAFVMALSGDKPTVCADLIPDMANAGTNENEDYTKLFDDDVETKWGFDWNNKPVSVVFHSETPIAVDSYIITTANDNETYKGRNPESWVLYGSTSATRPSYSDKSWEVIDEVSSSGIEDKNFEAYEYHVGSSTAYKYFKWTITARQGGQSFWNSYVQMSEFDIIVADTASAIGSAATLSPAATGTYNLQGQKVGEGYKGLVIKDGRKTIRK